MIDRIVIDNFKSIQHADVSLQKMNLLIGPNNSGKSNFLKAIIHLKNSIQKSNYYPQSYISVTDDNKDEKKTGFEIMFDKSDVISTLPQENGERNFMTIVGLSNLLRSVKIYKPDLGKLHLPYTIFQNDSSVLEDASNIASFLQTCLNKHRKQFNIITEELKKVLPVFEEIIIENVLPEFEQTEQKAGKAKPAVYEAPKIKIGFRDFANRTIWAEDLSEGALYFLALLCIIHQPEPPKLLLLEEPERSIHPRRIKEVIDLIRQLSDEKDIQVIMTTHSPLVVDLFEEEPESINIFEMKDGFTEIKNLKTDIIEPTNKELKKKGVDITKDYGTSLGEKWVYGFLGGVPV
jgi:predicted ATPase